MPNDDYIKRDDVLKVLCDKCVFESRCSRENEFCNQIQGIKAITAADVEPVRHGRWVSKEGIYGVVYCSICDFELKIDNTPRCPHCGAKMDAEPPKEEPNES